ncbi:MAG: hypothetical protein R3C68_06275 [Myxococcota bacterium]
MKDNNKNEGGSGLGIDPAEADELLELKAKREAAGGERIGFDSREYELGDKLLKQLAGRAMMEATDEMLFNATKWWCNYKETLSSETMKRIAYSEEAEYAALGDAVQEDARRHGYGYWPYCVIAFGIAVASAELRELEAQRARGEVL